VEDGEEDDGADEDSINSVNKDSSNQAIKM
jgi:hypothetical protein